MTNLQSSIKIAVFTGKIKKIYLKYQILLYSILSFLIPFIIYILTLQKKLIGGDTTWYALKLPIMEVMVPTGYPAFSILGKIFAMIPIGELAYRLNLLSAVFGALAILFLFLVINRLTKNAFISFSGALTLAFLLDFWTVANRLEFDTINSFFIALILYSMVLYTEKPERKNLYFFAAALGLSLTNHPLAFFIMPSFLLYIILVKPAMFKSARAVLTGILFFLMPLTLYAWLPIRSLMGYGPVTSLQNFIYYITGRNVTGRVHGSTFNHWDIKSFSNAGSLFGKILYDNIGIILLIVAIAGLIYLFKKNWKLAVSSVFLILLNFTITTLYLGWTPRNYMINIMMLISIYISMAFLFVYQKITGSFERVMPADVSASCSNGKNMIQLKKTRYLNCIVIAILLVLFLAPPVLMAAKNYKKADFSEPLGIYNFWNEVFDSIEDSSTIYISSSAANIGQFMALYERPEKNITFIPNKSEEYNLENINRDLSEGKKIYFMGIEEELIAILNIEKITSYYWDRMDEHVVLYNYAGEKKDIKISYEVASKEYRFGDKFELEYRIINENEADIELTSLELALPDNLDLLGVNQEGDIDLEPSMSRGKYMWVKTFTVKANSEINIILMLQAASPGGSAIDFAITSQDYYFYADSVELSITD